MLKKAEYDLSMLMIWAILIPINRTWLPSLLTTAAGEGDRMEGGGEGEGEEGRGVLVRRCEGRRDLWEVVEGMQSTSDSLSEQDCSSDST